MRVLVTGAAGFIGSFVCERLLARGDEVVGVDNFNAFYDPAIKERNARGLANERFRLVRADLAEDDAALEQLFERDRPDAICHLAAWAGVRPSIAKPLVYVRNNVDATAKLLDRAVRHEVRPFVFASSSSVYGARKEVPFREEDRVDDPVSPYAATKKAGELLGYTYSHLFGTRFVGLRFFTVYGPRQRPEMAIHLFTDRIRKGLPIRVHGDGSSSRDYTYIDDIVDGVIASIDRAARVEGYRIYNLGASDTTTLAELVALIEGALGRKAIIERHPDQPGDVPRTFADVSRAEAELGYAPKVKIADGVARFAKWIEAQG